MNQIKLKIVGCSDSMMWYADHVGETFPFIRIVSEGFISREPAGYSNIVKFKDAIIVDENDKAINLAEATW